MLVCFLQRLAVSVLCTLFLPSALSQNQTAATAGKSSLACMHFACICTYSRAALESCQLYHTVQGLLAFKAKTRDPQSLLASWNSSSMPCSTADCNSNKFAQDCNWAGIVCQNGQVVALAVPCTVQSNGATGACALQGAPLDSLAQVSIVTFDSYKQALYTKVPVHTSCCCIPVMHVYLV